MAPKEYEREMHPSIETHHFRAVSTMSNKTPTNHTYGLGARSTLTTILVEE